MTHRLPVTAAVFAVLLLTAGAGLRITDAATSTPAVLPANTWQTDDPPTPQTQVFVADTLTSQINLSGDVADIASDPPADGGTRLTADSKSDDTEACITFGATPIELAGDQEVRVLIEEVGERGGGGLDIIAELEVTVDGVPQGTDSTPGASPGTRSTLTVEWTQASQVSNVEACVTGFGNERGNSGQLSTGAPVAAAWEATVIP